MKFLTVIFIVLLSSSLYSAPAFPGAAKKTQPDGTEISIHLRGDEFQKWNEDSKNYTILKNSDNYWVYGLKNDLGQLYPSEHVVGKVDPDTLNISKSMQPVTLSTRSTNLRQRSVTPARSTPLSGTLKNLVLLVDFQDVTHNQYSTKEKMSEVFDGNNYAGAHGTVKDYFLEVSNGLLTIETTVVDWVTVSHTHAYYGSDENNTYKMVVEALQLVKNRGDINFSDFDNNNDGEVDILTVIHAGFGQEYPGNNAELIWSHQGFFSPINYHGVTLRKYHTEPEIMGSETTIYNDNGTPEDDSDDYPTTPIKARTRPGLICHEMCHIFGLPDLYDIDNSSQGIGDFCLMASGSWNGSGSFISSYATKPAHPSAWCKQFLGWSDSQTITADGTYQLVKTVGNNKVYKVEVPNNSNEYFLIENRQPTGFDEALPGSTQGILIWHIDDSQTNNKNENRYWVDLEEADGNQGLENNTTQGSDSDYFRADNVTQFSASTTPSHKTYTNHFLTSKISEVSDSKDTMTFKLSNMQSLAIQGENSINERSSRNYSCIATYADSSTENLPNASSWSTDTAKATADSSGLVTTQNVYNSTSFKLTAEFETLTAEKNITINDVDPGFTKIDQMLTSEDYVIEAFEEFVSPQVSGFNSDSISNYQTEFGRNIDYVNDKNNWYQEIVDEVNAGNNVVINHVTNGWNLLSSPFPGWTPNSIDSFVQEGVFSFNENDYVYEKQDKSLNLNVNQGYWVLYGQEGIANDQAVEYLMSGTLPSTPSGTLQIGWNLVGSEAGTETLQLEDQGFFWKTETQVYQGLSEGDTLKLGKAYWIFTSD